MKNPTGFRGNQLDLVKYQLESVKNQKKLVKIKLVFAKTSLRKSYACENQ